MIDFSEICQKKNNEIGCFLLIVSWQSFPLNFPLKSADFSVNLPRKSFEIWLFPAKMPRNRPIFLRILTFLPWHRPIFPRILTFPAKSADFSATFDFFPTKSADFSANLPLKIPRNFAFFSAKYQKPCMFYNYYSHVISNLALPLLNSISL